MKIDGRNTNVYPAVYFARVENYGNDKEKLIISSLIDASFVEVIKKQGDKILVNGVDFGDYNISATAINMFSIFHCCEIEDQSTLPIVTPPVPQIILSNTSYVFDSIGGTHYITYEILNSTSELAVSGVPNRWAVYNNPITKTLSIAAPANNTGGVIPETNIKFYLVSDPTIYANFTVSQKYPTSDINLSPLNFKFTQLMSSEFITIFGNATGNPAPSIQNAPSWMDVQINQDITMIIAMATQPPQFSEALGELNIYIDGKLFTISYDGMYIAI